MCIKVGGMGANGRQLELSKLHWVTAYTHHSHRPVEALLLEECQWSAFVFNGLILHLTGQRSQSQRSRIPEPQLSR